MDLASTAAQRARYPMHCNIASTITPHAYQLSVA